ncbi:hypothetical protein PAMP_018845 [Pampus punctatissimus]
MTPASIAPNHLEIKIFQAEGNLHIQRDVLLNVSHSTVVIQGPKGLNSPQSVGSVVFASEHYRLQSECRQNSQQRPPTLPSWNSLPQHPWLGELSRNKACLWPTSTSTLFPDLLAQMMAFSTSMDTVINIAIQKVEVAVVVAVAVRVGGVERKEKDERRKQWQPDQSESNCLRLFMGQSGQDAMQEKLLYTLWLDSSFHSGYYMQEEE